MTDETHTPSRFRLHVAIDGPAGSGKSTIGKKLARRLDCRFLDTGLMYRALTWCALQHDVDPDDVVALTSMGTEMDFQLSSGDEDGIVVDGRIMKDEVRTLDVDATVSRVAMHPGVREIMVKRQRQLARQTCMVMVGRDIGTVVLPSAQVKLWVTASPGERALRRFDEGLATVGDLPAVQAGIERRDEIDATRRVSPLRPAHDAIHVVTDGLTADEAVSLAERIVEERIRGALHRCNL